MKKFMSILIIFAAISGLIYYLTIKYELNLNLFTTYELTLPNYVTSNIENLDKIKEGTLVELTITEREDYYIDYIKANDIELEIENFQASFNIYEDTIITVKYIKISYYSLIIPDEISSNIENFDKLLYNTLVILTPNIPKGKEIKEFMKNNKPIFLTNDTYEFYLKEDTVIEISFRDEIEKEGYLNNEEKLIFFENMSFNLLSYQNINYFDYYYVENSDMDYKREIKNLFYFDLNEDLNLRQMYYENIYDGNLYTMGYLKDQIHYYYYRTWYDNLEKYEATLTDSYISYLLNNDLFNHENYYFQLNDIDELSNYYFISKIDNLDDFNIYKKENIYEINFSLKNDELLKFKSHFNAIFNLYYEESLTVNQLKYLDKYFVNFNILVKNNKIIKLKIEMDIADSYHELNYFEYYDEVIINSKFELDNAYSMGKRYKTSIYDKDEILLNIEHNGFYELEGFLPYFQKDGYVISGFYQDQNLLHKIDNLDDIIDDKIYIKYIEKERLDLNRIKNYLDEEVVLYEIDYLYHDEIITYYEDLDYIYYKNSNDYLSSFIYIKNLDILYSYKLKYSYEEGKDIYIIYEVNNSILLNLNELKNILDDDFIFINNKYVSNNYVVEFYNYYFDQIKINDKYYQVKNKSTNNILDEIDFIKNVIEEEVVIKDKIRDIYIQQYFEYDLDERENDFSKYQATVVFESDSYESYNLLDFFELFNVEIKEINTENNYNNYLVFLIEGNEYKININTYKSTKGVKLHNNNNSYIYLDDVNDFEELFNFGNQVFIPSKIKINNYLFDDLEQLKNHHFKENNVYFDVIGEEIELDDLLMILKEEKVLINSNISTDLLIDFKNKTVEYLNIYSSRLNFKLEVNDDNYFYMTENTYYTLPKNEFGLSVLKSLMNEDRYLIFNSYFYLLENILNINDFSNLDYYFDIDDQRIEINDFINNITYRVSLTNEDFSKYPLINNQSTLKNNKTEDIIILNTNLDYGLDLDYMFGYTTYYLVEVKDQFNNKVSNYSKGTYTLILEDQYFTSIIDYFNNLKSQKYIKYEYEDDIYYVYKMNEIYINNKFDNSYTIKIEKKGKDFNFYKYDHINKNYEKISPNINYFNLIEIIDFYEEENLAFYDNFTYHSTPTSPNRYYSLSINGLFRYGDERDQYFIIDTSEFKFDQFELFDPSLYSS